MHNRDTHTCAHTLDGGNTHRSTTELTGKKKRGSERKRGEVKGERKEAERSRVEREEGEEESQGGAGEASVYPANRMKRKRLFYTQVRSWESAVPVREKVNCTCTRTTRGELGVELNRRQKRTKKKPTRD